MNATKEEKQSVIAVLESYNLCFYDRDIEALKAMYLDAAEFVFWDNHPDCDSASLDDHVAKVGKFFDIGKNTESGDVEPLIVESPQVQLLGETAVLTTNLRYRSAPKPGVRSTFVVRLDAGEWKIAHVHHSFDPSESAEPPK